MRVNRQIRAPKIRLIDQEGNQIGIVTVSQALQHAEEAGLDLVEISPNAVPPVCKIVDYGKYRYQQTKKDKESKKAQHLVKLKEVKLKPNIDDHDLQVKVRHAREFLEKGNKVRVTCMFRGREMAHQDIGRRVVENFCKALEEVSVAETMPKQMGRNLIVVLNPQSSKKKSGEVKRAKDENTESSSSPV